MIKRDGGVYTHAWGIYAPHLKFSISHYAWFRFLIFSLSLSVSLIHLFFLCVFSGIKASNHIFSLKMLIVIYQVIQPMFLYMFGFFNFARRITGNGEPQAANPIEVNHVEANLKKKL